MPEYAKQLVVQDYTKPEIVEIVNDGIAHGHVNLPAGGTKLYNHQIVSTFGTTNVTFSLVTLFSIPFKSVSTSGGPARLVLDKDLPNASDGILVGIINQKSGIVSSENWFTQKNGLVLHYNAFASISTAVDISGFTQDTVTEL